MRVVPSEDDYVLDPVIASLTAEWTEWPLCEVRIMNDRRFPWLLLIPRRPGAEEIYRLEQADRAALMEEIARASRLLAQLYPTHKINVGSLGNAVRQIHVHVMARHEQDAMWPAAVWGHGGAIPYDEAGLAAFRQRLFARLRK